MAADFSEFETTTRRDVAIAGRRAWFSKLEHPFHTSPMANQHDAIAAVELAPGRPAQHVHAPLIDACEVGDDAGEIQPVVTIVTDNGGPFRSLDVELFINTHLGAAPRPPPRDDPSQNGSREGGFGT